jgi:phage baseplate assembly protein W
MEINYPFRVDGRGRVADANEADHIRQMIEQVLFTAPGERVNRPDFGSGVEQLLFAPNSDELAAATQFLIKGSLEQWLGEVIEVEAVEVENQESSLQILVQYRIRHTQQRQIAEFTRNG